jgi:predicted lipoprotein with Yx(FWY)xxD motif
MNTQFKRIFVILSSLLVIIVLSGCGSSGSTSSYSGSNSTSSAKPTTAPATTASTPDTSKDYGNGNTSTTTSTTGGVVKTASVTVGGKSLTVLTNAQGLTLYYFKPDTASTSACTGGCASSWPPLLFSTGKPTAVGQLPGVLDVSTNANGQQVIYNNHPLYTFSGDSAPGQTNGQGIAGKWFVVTTDIAKI